MSIDRPVLKDSARMQLLSQKAKALYLFFETDSQSIDKVVSTWQYNIGKVEYEAEHTHTHSYVSGLERRVHALEQALLATKPGVELEDIIPPDHDILRQQLSSVIIGEDTVVDVESPFTADVTSGNSTPDLLSTGLHGFDWGEREPGSFGVSDGCQQEREGSIGYFGICDGTLTAKPPLITHLGKLTNVALLRMLYKTDLLWGGPSQRHDDSPSARLVDEGSTTIAWEDLMPPQGTQWFTEFFINAYFNYFHTTYPLLHEPTFRAQFSELLPRPPEEAWSLLTRAVLALGAWCTGFDITVGSRKGPPDYFALFRNINLFESGSLCMVQALTLLGTFLHKQCKFNSSSIYLGAAVKMALSLGLHREFSHCDISLLDREMRRRVWWCLYILDSGAAMTMGRPILLPSLSAIGIKKPLNVPEQVRNQSLCYKRSPTNSSQCVTARTSVEPEESRGLTIYSNLIAQVEFHMLANKTYNAFVSNPEVSIQGLLNFEDKVEAWCRSLPPHLQEDWPQHGPCPNLGFSSSHLLWRVRCIKAALFFPTFMEVVRKSRTQPTAPPLRDDQREVLCISVRQAHDSVNDIHHFFLKESLDGLRNWYAR